MNMEILIEIVIVLIIIDIILFYVLLFRKINKKMTQKAKNKMKEKFEILIGEYIRGEDVLQKFNKLSRIEQNVLESLCFEYVKYLRGDTRNKILDILKTANIFEIHLKNINSKFWWKQVLSAFYLGIYQVEQALDKLISLLYSKNPEIVYNSAKAILRISNQKNLKLVLEALVKNEKITTDKILDLLSDVEGDIYPELSQYLNSEKNPKLKNISIYSLANRKDYKIIPLLIGMMQSNNAKTIVQALTAIEMLGTIEDDKILDILLLMLQYDIKEIKLLLAKITLNYKDERSINILKSLIIDTDEDVIISAGNALLHQGKSGLMTLVNAKFSENVRTKGIVMKIINNKNDL